VALFCLEVLKVLYLPQPLLGFFFRFVRTHVAAAFGNYPPATLDFFDHSNIKNVFVAKPAALGQVWAWVFCIRSVCCALCASRPRSSTVGFLGMRCATCHALLMAIGSSIAPFHPFPDRESGERYLTLSEV